MSEGKIIIIRGAPGTDDLTIKTKALTMQEVAGNSYSDEEYYDPKKEAAELMNAISGTVPYPTFQELAALFLRRMSLLDRVERAHGPLTEAERDLLRNPSYED